MTEYELQQQGIPERTKSMHEELERDLLADASSVVVLVAGFFGRSSSSLSSLTRISNHCGQDCFSFVSVCCCSSSFRKATTSWYRDSDVIYNVCLYVVNISYILYFILSTKSFGSFSLLTVCSESDNEQRVLGRFTMVLYCIRRQQCEMAPTTYTNCTSSQ